MSLRITLLLLAIAHSANAQLIGVSLGGVSSTVDWELPRPMETCRDCISGVSPNASRKSVAPALMLYPAPSRSIGFDTEVRYTLKGFAVTEPTLNLHYLEVPALLRLGAISTSTLPVHLFMEAGPAVSLRVHCEVDYNGTSDDCDRGAAFGQDWRIRLFDVSGLVGAGVAVRVGDNTAILGTRYDYGFVNIGSSGQGRSTKNRSILIYLGWLWPMHSAAP
jgi:hypothetical protein